MKKNKFYAFLATFAALLAAPSALSVLPQTEQQTFQPSLKINLLSNSGFENGKSGWNFSNNSNTIFALTTGASNAIEGNASLVFTPSDAGQYVESPLLDFPAGREGGACLAAVRATSNETNNLYFLRVLKSDNTDVVLDNASTDANKLPQIPTSSGLTEKSAIKYVAFTCPPSGTKYKIRVESSGGAAVATKIDSLWFGTDFRLVGAPAGAQWVGSIKWAQTANCSWNVTSGAASADSDCPNPTTSGLVSAPGTKIPAVTLPSLKSGQYLFLFRGAFYSLRNVDSSHGANWAVNDGTTSIFAGRSGGFPSGVNTYSESPTLTASYSAAEGSGKTFDLRTTSCSSDCQIKVTDNDFEISVYFFPSEGTLNGSSIDSINWRAEASISGANVTLSSSSVVTPNALESGSFTMADLAGATISSMIPCSSTNQATGKTCSSGNESLGIAFNAPRSGLAYGECSFRAEASSNSSSRFFASLVKTGNDNQTILETGSIKAAFSFAGSVVYGGILRVGGFFSVTAGLNTFRVFYTLDTGSSVSGSVMATNATDYASCTFRPADYIETAFARMAGYIDSGINSGSKQLIVTFASSSNEDTACSSSPCTVYENPTGKVTGVTRGGTGNYTVAVQGGFFSAVPYGCYGSSTGGANASVSIDKSNSSATSLNVRTAISGSDADAAVTLVCFGR